MKKIFKKKVSLFGKEFSVFALVAVAMVTLASAALLPYFGLITGNAIVSQGLLVDGGGYSSDITEDFPSFTSLEQKTFLSLHNLKNNADVDADLKFVRTCKNSSNVDCDSDITTTYQKWVSTSATTGVRSTVIYDEDDNLYKMWYKTAEGDSFIFYADSSDGIAWGNITTTDVAGTSDAPFVMKEGSTYYMVNYGTATTFNIYTSNNGLTWINKGVIYTKDINSSFVKIDNPKLLKTATGYNMYFQAKITDSSDYSIFMATTTKASLSAIADAGAASFTGKVDAILVPSDSGWDSWRIMQPMVIKEGEQYIMMYVGYNLTDTNGKIGYAVSSDGVSVFDKVNVSTEGYDSVLGTNAWKPSLVNADGEIVLFYMNSGTTIAKATLTTVLTGVTPAGGKITVPAGETRGFFIENNFSQMLVPDTYKITTEIDVA